MAELADQVQMLLDRQAIADCVQRYARGIDRHDVDLVASCYHPDAIDDHGFYLGPGRGLAEWTLGVHENFPRHQHHITNQVVELCGDTAHAETYYLVVRTDKSGVPSVASGRYVDRFERRDGEWKIAARVCLVEEIGNMTGVDMAAVERSFVQGARDRGDISYRRPLVVKRQYDPPPPVHAPPRRPR
jgi:ketosteroid isomerase-like protein